MIDINGNEKKFHIINGERVYDYTKKMNIMKDFRENQKLNKNKSVENIFFSEKKKMAKGKKNIISNDDDPINKLSIQLSAEMNFIDINSSKKNFNNLRENYLKKDYNEYKSSDEYENSNKYENDKDDGSSDFKNNINILGNNFFNENVIDDYGNDDNSNRRSTLQNTFENSNSIFNQRKNEPNILSKDKNPKKKSVQKKKSKKKPKKNQIDLGLNLFEF